MDMSSHQMPLVMLVGPQQVLVQIGLSQEMLSERMTSSEVRMDRMSYSNQIIQNDLDLRRVGIFLVSEIVPYEVSQIVLQSEVGQDFP